MATGIVSIAAADHGYHVISAGLAVLAVAGLAVLVVAAAFAWRREPLDLAQPETAIPLLTFVAACAVVGTRLSWWPLGLVGFVGWLLLMPLALRAMWRYRWTGLRDRARGGGELASVATSGLAIVAADLGWVGLAIGLLVLAVCLYFLMTGLVLWRAVHDTNGTRAVPARRVDPDGRCGDRDVGGRSHPQGRLCGDTAGDRRDMDGRDAVDSAAGRDQRQAPGRKLVGRGLPLGDVLVGDVRHGRRNGLAAADDGLAGVLLDRLLCVARRHRRIVVANLAISA